MWCKKKEEEIKKPDDMSYDDWIKERQLDKDREIVQKRENRKFLLEVVKWCFTGIFFLVILVAIFTYIAIRALFYIPETNAAERGFWDGCLLFSYEDCGVSEPNHLGIHAESDGKLYCTNQLGEKRQFRADGGTGLNASLRVVNQITENGTPNTIKEHWTIYPIVDGVVCREWITTGTKIISTVGN